MEKNGVEVNSLKAWILAARPKTLTGAAVPVMIGTALALADSDFHIRIVPTVLCFLFAFIMQIDANFVNDYFDFLKGTDDEKRLGPKRACAQGWVTTKAMRWALALTTMFACAVGLPLIYYGGWWMIAVGLLCVFFCFLYTTHLVVVFRYRSCNDDLFSCVARRDADRDVGVPICFHCLRIGHRHLVGYQQLP